MISLQLCKELSVNITNVSHKLAMDYYKTYGQQFGSTNDFLHNVYNLSRLVNLLYITQCDIYKWVMLNTAKPPRCVPKGFNEHILCK